MKKNPSLKLNCDYDTLIQKLGKDDNVTKRKFRELIQSRRPGKHEKIAQNYCVNIKNIKSNDSNDNFKW